MVRATGLIVEAGLELYFADRAEGLAIRQRAVVGQVACQVSRAIAELISQPAAWRIAALVSTARLLTPWIGLTAAAMVSAASVRQFQKECTKAQLSLDRSIGDGACAAVNRGDVEAMAQVSSSIAARLNGVAPLDCAGAAEEEREMHAGSHAFTSQILGDHRNEADIVIFGATAID